MSANDANFPVQMTVFTSLLWRARSPQTSQSLLLPRAVPQIVGLSVSKNEEVGFTHTPPPHTLLYPPICLLTLTATGVSEVGCLRQEGFVIHLLTVEDGR